MNTHTSTPHAPRTADDRGLRAHFLGSGSSGNCSVFTDGTTTVLVDCGFAAREVARRLASVGIDADSVSAILITHEHIDHMRGIEVFMRRHSPEVIGTIGTLRAAGKMLQGLDTTAITAGSTFMLGTIEVLAFQTAHDSAEPVGYRLSAGGVTIGLATDTGHVTEHTFEALSECDVIAIESNHDLEMLMRGPYPWFLKQRIASRDGHLSNADCAAALRRLATDRLTRVHALHLSSKNNTHSHAADALERVLRELDHGADIEIVPQNR